VSQRSNVRNRSRAEHISGLLFTAGALGESVVGLALLAYPGKTVDLLLNATLDASGFVVARVLGAGLIALGLTWWFARLEPERRGLRRCTPGFIVYNLGAGLVIVLQALAAARAVPVVWLAAVLHVLVGLGMVMAVVARSPAAKATPAE